MIIIVVLVAATATSRRRDHRIARLEGDELVAEEGLVEELVQRPLLDEVLVIDVTVAGRVNPDEVILSLVLYQCVA